MDDLWVQFPEDQWDAGFEGDRFIVVARLWPFIRVFQRPPGFRRRFWHSIHELAIRDWNIPLEQLHFDQLCVIESELKIRYQPTTIYAREHLDFLHDLNAHLENSLGPLIKDIAEQEIRRMENDTAWLKEGCGGIEKAVADIVNEVLVMRGVQCRALCRIEPRFAPIDAVDLDALPPWLRHQAVYEEYLRRRREARERILHEQTEEAANEKRLLMERESTLLDLEKREEEQRESRRHQELESLQAALAAEESRLAEQRASEQRKRDGQLHHAEQLRQMQAEAELKAKEAELEKQRAKLAVEKTLQEEKLESELKHHREQLQYETLLRTMQAETEMKANLAELEKQRAIEEARLSKQRESEARHSEEKLRHKARLLQLQTEADLKAREMELERLREEMARVEIQLEEQRQCEARQREEQLRHEARLRELQTEQELKEKELRAPAIAELENYLNREIGLLATERQRLMLEEEIRDVKLSRTQGFIPNSIRRLPLGQDQIETNAGDGAQTGERT